MSKKLTLSQQKRAAIVEAARNAFKEHGTDGTSMDTIAAIAQVSKKTVYNHFPSKEDLVMHLIKENWSSATQNLGISYDPEQPLRNQLVRLVHAEVRIFSSEEHLGLARTVMGHFLYKPEKYKEEIFELCEKETDLLRFIKAAIQDNQLKNDDPEFMMCQLHYLLKGGCFWPQITNIYPRLSLEKMDHLLNQSVNMFLSYYQK